MNTTAREQALNVIMNEDGMVVVNGVKYTKANVNDLPSLEDFVEGNPDAQAEALQKLMADKAALEARVAALTVKVEANAGKKEVKEAKEAATEAATEAAEKKVK